MINFLPDDTEGSSKVEPPYTNIQKHVRITLRKLEITEINDDEDLDAVYRSRACTIARLYCEKWKCHTFIWGFEYSKEDKTPHFHGTITYSVEPKASTMSDWMKMWKEWIPCASGYIHESLKKKIIHSELYTIKDDIIFCTNYNEKYIDWIKSQRDLIQENMKLSAKEKVFNEIKNAFNDKIGSYKVQFNSIKMVIVSLYVNIWDKLPPPNVKQLALYCAVKLRLCDYSTLDYHL